MEELGDKTSYKIILYAYASPLEDLKKYKIEFEGKQLVFLEILNKYIYISKEIFNFKIIKESEIIPFQINLIHNYVNEIALDFTDIKSKRYNIEFLIDNESMLSPKLKIKIKDKVIKYETNYNDLNLSRIVVLNTDLDFHAYLNYRIESKSEKYEEKKKEDKKNINKGKGSKKKPNNKIIQKEFRLLGKKRKFESKENSNEIEMQYLIDKDKILSNNLLFCIHFYDNNNTTITIHDKINENKTNIKNKNITAEQLEKIYNKIKNKTDNLYNIIDKIDLNKFKEKIINELKEFSYDSSIINENIENNGIFTNNDYLLSMEYFYNFIICTIRDTINSIIEKFLVYSNNPTSYECDIVKINLKYILLKFSQFNDYTDYINKKNTKFIKNLIVNKNNLSLHEKIKIFSVLLTIIFSSPIYYPDTKIEFFDINYNEKNIYLSAKNFLNKIINELKTNSIYLKGLKQTFSRIKIDLNKNNYGVIGQTTREVFIIEMRTLKELKEKIKLFFPDIIVRFVNSRSFSNAMYELFSKNIIINEIIYKNRENDYYKNNKDNEIFDCLSPYIKGEINLENEENKYYYNLYLFQAFWRINHESLGHKPVAIINGNKKETPNKFIVNGKFKKISDAGRILEYFLTDDFSQFNELKISKFNVESLLNEKLFVQTSFDNFWNEYYKLEKSYQVERKEKEKELYEFIYDIYDETNDFKIEKYIPQKKPLIIRQYFGK